MRAAIGHAFSQFLKTTTLHGFKYLGSPFYIDRAGWLTWCVASACCAGMLCAVLWDRFLQVPALLVVNESGGERSQRAPTVAVCNTPHRASQLFVQRLSLNAEQTVLLAPIFHNILRGLHLPSEELRVIEKLLHDHKLSLTEALLLTTLECTETIRRCRWRGREVPCSELFVKELTQWGACCVAKAESFHSGSGSDLISIDPSLDLVLKSIDETDANSYEFFTKYQGEEWVFPLQLTAGYRYSAQLTFGAIQEKDADRLVDTSCVFNAEYSRRRCLLRGVTSRVTRYFAQLTFGAIQEKDADRLVDTSCVSSAEFSRCRFVSLIQCKERKCGCSDPLRTIQSYESHVPPPCILRNLNCLRSFKLIDSSCSCPAACNKISSVTALEASRLNQIHHTYDPLLRQLNATSTVLSIRLRNSDSRVFDLKYTETWWSLLSSLGGVFNMFLGVGLFSALEFLFLVVGRLPVAIRRFTELQTRPIR